MSRSPAAKTVVVLDDSTIILEAVAAVLGASGFDVRTAARLSELERHCAECTPDLVVLDVHMPEAFGDEVGAVLREARTVRAPLLLFSSLDEELLAERTREAGLQGYVSKSAGVGALLERVCELLGVAPPPEEPSR
jgi:DNA-binding response OmpR family regulator